MASRAPLVGRNLELRALLTALGLDSNATARQRQRAAVVVGDAGVGKTRVAEEVIDAAREHGVEASVVRVTTALGSVPLGSINALVPVDDHASGRRADLLLVAAEALARDDATLLVVDDAHLLDAMSAGALHLAASRSSIRLLLTVRSGVECDDAITALWKDGLAVRIDLTALDRAGTDALACGILGGPLDAISAGQLFSSSGGNALYVRELLLGALNDGLIDGSGEVHRFNARLRSTTRLAALLGARLDDLAAAEREALDLLALGGEIGLGALRLLVDDTVLASLEDRGLLEVAVDGRRQPVRLAHPLYGEFLRDRMGLLREMAANRALAEQLEHCGARRRNDPLDLARWHVASGALPPPDILLAAARQARERFDPELAEQLATKARESGAGVEADLIVAESLADRGLHRDAADRFQVALAAARSDGVIVHAASAMSEIAFWSLHDEPRAIATVEHASQRVHGDGARFELDAHRASFEAMANRPVEALDRAAPHLDRADQRAYLLAAIAVGPALTVVGRSLDAVTLMDEAISSRIVASDVDALPAAFQYTMSKVFALSEAGLIAQAASLADETYRFAAALHAVVPIAWSAMVGGRVALMGGSLPAAAGRFAEAARLFEEINEPGLRSWAVAGSVLSAAQRGLASDAAVRAAELAAIDPGPVRAMQADVDRAVAWSRRIAGDFAGAASTLEVAVADANARGAYGMSLSLIHDLARVGDRSAARLLEDNHRTVQGVLAARRIDLLEALAMDDGAGLDRISDDFAELGCWLFAAEAAAAASAAHERADSRRRSVVSRSKSSEFRGHIPGAATPLLVSNEVAVGLTTRERQIAELAAAGWSSREIAATMERSIRTVENHLQRVYDKLGVSRRAELAALFEPATDVH